MNENNIIQIYAQSSYHTPAYIMGTRAGLIALRDVIGQTINRDECYGVDAFDSQGEGYAIIIRECAEDELESLQAQYTDIHAQHERGGVYPWELCKEGE